MRKTILSILLIIVFFELSGQSGLSIGFTPSLTYNFNNPDNKSQLNEFNLKSNYPSLKVGVNIYYERNRLALNLSVNYQFNKYGWQVVYSEASNTGSLYNLDELIMSTESLSFDLMLQFLITPFHHNKAKLYFDLGGGYSFITHTQLYGHYRIIIKNYYFSKVLTHNQADIGSKVNSPFVKGGLSVKAHIKKVGKINYGLHYAYYTNTLPEMNVELTINDELFTSTFRTKHSYLELFVTYYIFNYWKRGTNDRVQKINYR